MTPEQIVEVVKLIGRESSQMDGNPLIEEAYDKGYIKDVCSGDGWSTYKITTLGFKVTGLDPNDVYIS
jgi:hypothetical protein